MRKLLTILVLFCSVVCFSQAPRQLNAYTPQTQINFLGTIGNDSGVVFRTNFADTTTANLGWIKNIPNVLVTINDTLFKRSNDVTHWMQVGSGAGGGNTIYTGDGSLSGDRSVDIGQHHVSFDNSTYPSGLLYVEGDDAESFVGIGDWDENVNGVYVRVDDVQKTIIIAGGGSDGTGTIEMRGNTTINGQPNTLFNIKDPSSGVIYVNVKNNDNGIILQNSSGRIIGLDDDFNGYFFNAGPGGTGTYTADTHTFNGVLNLTIQAAPASPNDGDIWRESNTNDGLKIRVNGITKTISLL